MENLFTSIYRYFNKHPKVRNLSLFIIIIICGFMALRVSFEEDISKMLNIDKETEELATLLKKTKSTDQLIMRVYAVSGNADKDTLMHIADSLVEVITEKCGRYLKDIKAAVSQEDFLETYSIIAKNFPVFINAAKYDTVPLIQPAKLDSTLSGYLRTMATPGGIFAREGLQYDPAGFTFEHLLNMREMQTASKFTAIDGYLFSKDEKNLIILMTPQNNYSETRNNSKLVKQLDKITKDFNNGELGSSYHIQYFGAPRVAVGNSVQVQKDTSITIFVVLVCVLLLLVSVFGKKRLPLLIVATVSFAGLFSLAVVSLFETTLSLIAIGAGAVILGIAVNYPIHFFTHYMHSKNAEETIKSMVFPMTVGSLTTVGGFLCLTLVGSPLLADFGLFAAFCLIGAALFSLIYLPHMSGKVSHESKPSKARLFFERISSYPLDKKPVPIIIIAVLTPVLLYFSFDVEYESDLSKLNYISKSVKSAEDDFNALSDVKNTLVLVSKGKTPEEALSHSYEMYLLTDSLNKAGHSYSYIGVSKGVPPKNIQQKNIDKWNNYWKESREPEKEDIVNVFQQKGLNTALFNDFFSKLNGDAEIIPEDDYNYLINVFGSDYLYTDSTISTIISQIITTPEHKQLIAQLISNNENTKILNKQMITESLLNTVNDDFDKITFYTSLLVFIAILLSYGRIELTLITFLPMVISWIWILGIMGLFGIKFNIVNIILSTFIFGLGDDFCIFTTDGCLKSYRRRENHTSVVRMGIIISGLTGLIGLGALLFAKHPAMYSLATISILGILSVLFISQTLQPFLFRVLITNPTSKGRAPISLLTIINSLFFFTYFILGCILLSVLTLLLWLLPLRKKRKKLILHYLIHYMCRSVFTLAFTVKKIRINYHKQTFEKPSVIIANHQSMIDILQIMALSPKMVFVVKDWVWKSPLMGTFVRFAGFHTVANGLENIENYRKTIDEGYSIAIFPESSRTNGKSVKRFHKGAFYLAEKLQVDILPVIIQNNYETLPKGTFTVYPNQVTCKIFDKITPDDTTFGNGYRERTKQVAAFYREQYAKLGEEVATNRYCTRKLKDAYMYKGPVLEWYLRIKLKIENTYTDFNKIVPQKGCIIDAGCGYGFLPYVLSIKSAKRNIVGIDYDEEKIADAENSYIRTHKVNFEQEDITRYTYPQADCYIFSDVLHYINLEDIECIAEKVSAKINAGGMVIIRDADKGDHKFNKVSEFLSTKIFKFNKATSHLNFFTTEDICKIFAKYGFVPDIIHNNGFAINTYWILKKF